MYVDTHAHINMPDYVDLSEVLERAKEAKVEAIIDVGFDLESSKASVRLSRDQDFVFSSIGIHPHDADKVSDKDIDELKSLAASPKVVAVGEIGLDYYRNLSPKDAQISLFKKLLGLAQDLDLPVIIHSRDSHDEALRILHEANRGKLKGVMHCFSADVSVAKLVLDLGFYISFAGSITFKKANNLRDTAKFVPLDRLLIETDSPYLAPDPFRGKRSEPSYVVRVAQTIAQVRGLSAEEIGVATTQNAKKLFSKISV